jgi:hypothetical protein
MGYRPRDVSTGPAVVEPGRRPRWRPATRRSVGISYPQNQPSFPSKPEPRRRALQPRLPTAAATAARIRASAPAACRPSSVRSHRLPARPRKASVLPRPDDVVPRRAAADRIFLLAVEVGERAADPRPGSRASGKPAVSAPEAAARSSGKARSRRCGAQTLRGLAKRPDSGRPHGDEICRAAPVSRYRPELDDATRTDLRMGSETWPTESVSCGLDRGRGIGTSTRYPAPLADTGSSDSEGQSGEVGAVWRALPRPGIARLP